MRVAIFLPILGGPGLIRSITPLFNVPGNHVHLSSDYMRDPEISGRYTQFTAKGGLLSDFLDPDIPSYDLELDVTPESGRSWELPVALAHWVYFQGHQIVTEAPDVVIWATGSLGSGGEIISESYHVKNKLDASRDRLEEMACPNVIVLLPHEQDMGFAKEVPGVSSLVSVTSLGDAVAALDVLKVRPALSPAAAEPASCATQGTQTRLRRHWLAAAILVLALIGAGALSWLAFTPRDGPGTPIAADMPASGPHAPDDIAADEWLRLEDQFTMNAGLGGSFYVVDIHNPGPSGIRDISVRAFNGSGDGLLVDEGAYLGPGATGTFTFNLHNEPEDRATAMICLSGKPGEHDQVYHEKLTLASGRVTGQEARFGSAWPDCADPDFSWQTYPSQPACEAAREQLGEFGPADCDGLPAEEPGVGLMEWGKRDDLFGDQ